MRGRIRFDDQLRRPGSASPCPSEVRYDEFTDDVLPNQLVKAAAYRLGRTRLRSARARAGIGLAGGDAGVDVSLIEFPPIDVPAVRYDRLNEHYRSVVELSRLILRHGAFEAGRGVVRASGFLMDMNVVFQEFVTVALREDLGLSPAVFGERNIDSLDSAKAVSICAIRPDLVGWPLLRLRRRCQVRTSRITHFPASSATPTSPTNCWPTPPRLTCPVAC